MAVKTANYDPRGAAFHKSEGLWDLQNCHFVIEPAWDSVPCLLFLYFRQSEKTCAVSQEAPGFLLCFILCEFIF